MNEDEIMTTDENAKVEVELPMEDKKKAVNLQDLVFVRQYIDGRLEDYRPDKLLDEISDNYYDKTEIDETFYKKTDTVANASHAVNATNAENAVDANTASFAVSAGEAAHAANADNANHAISADTATNATNATKAESATNADYATNAGHATTAVSADTTPKADLATNAENTVKKTDGSFIGLVIDENGVMKFNDGQTVLNAENAAHATNADNAEEAEHALSADTATNATNAEEAAHADEATHANSADTATNAENASKATYAESAGYADNCENATYAENAGQVNNAINAETAGTALNALTINGVTITQDNSVLKNGEDIIISQKKLLFNPSSDLQYKGDGNSDESICEVPDGSKLEIHCGSHDASGRNIRDYIFVIKFNELDLRSRIYDGYIVEDMLTHTEDDGTKTITMLESCRDKFYFSMSYINNKISLAWRATCPGIKYSMTESKLEDMVSSPIIADAIIPIVSVKSIDKPNNGRYFSVNKVYQIIE